MVLQSKEYGFRKEHLTLTQEQGEQLKLNFRGGVSVKGAGMWRSTIQGAYAGLLLQGGNVTLSDFSIKSEETYRSNSSGIVGVEGNALNSTISNLWIQHTKVGFWLNEGTENALVTKCRVRDVWADRININGGTKNTIESSAISAIRAMMAWQCAQNH